MSTKVNVSKEYIKSIELLEEISHDQNSYTKLFKREKRVIKLYEHDHINDVEVISRDIETLLAVTKLHLPQNHYAVPLKILTCEKKIIGYEMQYIKGKTLASALKEERLTRAKQWFLCINQDRQFIETLHPGFAFGDLHEDNILVDLSGNLVHCDLDGWQIRGGKGKYARYLNMQKELFSYYPHKYKRENSSGFYIMDSNTDILSLIMIILNYIMRDSIPFAALTKIEAVEYLRFLDRQGMPKAFMRMLQRIYSREDNYIDEDAIMNLPEDICRFSYQEFYASRSKYDNEDLALKYIMKKYGKYT